MSCLRSTTATHSRLPSRASRGGRYRYLTGLTWPYDTVNAQSARDNALGLVEQDPNLPPGQTATFENELTADIASYAVRGTPDYLTAQFAKVQTWARANRVKPWQILVRSEEHTSELQSQFHLVCRLLLEKKK